MEQARSENATKRMREGDNSPEKLRALNDVIIFTTTLYKNDEQSRIRQALGLKFLKNASALGIRTVVVDGGSNEEYLEKAAQLPGITIVRETPGATMGAGRRQALDEALKYGDASVFFWAEPEKDTLICESSLGDMVEKIKRGEADIVVPRRKEKDSLPKFQKWEEGRANERAGLLLKDKAASEDGPSESPKDPGEFDLWFGPKMFNRESARYFSEYKGGGVDRWDSVIAPVIDAHKDGKKVASVDVDYTYDPSQVNQEENDPVMNAKRIDQYRQIFAALGDNFWSREGKGIEHGKPKRTELKRNRSSK